MKPLLLEFQAFGPYEGKEIIDFEQLSSKGLFLICGETGSGKTMILDAITFALYGMSSGNARNDFMAMRCTGAAFDVTTFVKFIFEVNSGCYLFERRLTRKTKNLSPSYNLMKKDEEGNWQVLLENPKEKELNKKAVELIGLEYEQFRQVILLPQGQFEKLLTSNSDEKEKILSNIFGEGKWRAITERFYETARKNKEKLNVIQTEIKSSLAEENCESIDELKEKLEAQKQQLKKLQTEYSQVDYDKVIKENQEALILAERFAILHRAETKRQQLQDNKANIEEKKEKREAALRAEQVKPYMFAADAEKKNLKARNAELTTLEEALEEIKLQEKEAEESLRIHVSKKEEIELLKKKQVSYEDKRQDYADIVESEKECRKYESEINKAHVHMDGEKQKLDSISKIITKLQDEYNCKDEEHRNLMNKYINGIAGFLAEGLEEGISCPVCGSKSHPFKAAVTGESIKREDVEKKARELDEIKNKLLDIKDEFNIINSGYEEKRNSLNELVMKQDTAKAVLADKKKKLIEGIADSEVLESEIENIVLKIHEYEKKNEELENNEKELKEKSTKIKTRLETARKEAAATRTKLDEAEICLGDIISQKGFEDIEAVKKHMVSEEKLSELKKTIDEYEADINAVQKSIEDSERELEDKKEPDRNMCIRLIDEATEAIKSFTSLISETTFETERLTKKYENLNNKAGGITEKLIQAENDMIFAKKLRGDTGTGLQRYVLGIMFSSVIAAANKMLELVHGGRYRLFRSDDKKQGSNKRGLELKVYDKFSDDINGRFVNTLSGGEKFLVSLALSIGMSSIAKSSGVKIDALFIDEGFGSLDENSIADAMNVLAGIQQANGLVGIISHVQVLQDNIMTKLMVNKEDGKSHISLSIG